MTVVIWKNLLKFSIHVISDYKPEERATDLLVFESIFGFMG